MLPIWLRPNIAYTAKLRPQAALGLANAAAAVFPFAVTNGYFDWTGNTAQALGLDMRETLEGLLKRPVV